MRKDMAKVIVERPRRKAYKNRKGRRQDFEDMPTHEGMRKGRAVRGECKELNENLAPLHRYLASQVGRPWAKIYSEICANLGVRSTVQQHVRDHLRDYVAVKPRRDINSWHSGLRHGLWWQDFYVNSATGLLCRTDQLPEEKARRRVRGRRPHPPVERIAIGDDRELRLINGLWYEVRLASLPEPQYRTFREIRKIPRKARLSDASPVTEVEINVRRLASPAVRDVASGEMIDPGPSCDDPESWERFRRLHPNCHYVVAKRVLSKRGLRRRGLRNRSTA